ncbi:MAG: polyprenyl synthetase family protein [Clostridiales bacterium]|nr:polyprenyl synthetase family protein [Clostridiales bacterium]
MIKENNLIFEDLRNNIELALSNFTKTNTIYNNKPSVQHIVSDAMEYSLSAGGKRIRPILVLSFCKMCGGDYSKYYDIACTIEMIHTFSLIHDDLPCMDDDDFRRGKPSCHKVFPESIALLAGDALATHPYEVISKKAINGEISFETAVRLTDVLSKNVGVNGMIGGQVIDLESENKIITVEELNLLQSYKTSALIKASCKMGCILAGRYDMLEIASEYADALGKAFQIVDDILDVTGSFEELGKPIGSDSQQHKSTYVSLLGLENSKREADLLTQRAVELLENFDNNEFLVDLTKSLLARKN